MRRNRAAVALGGLLALLGLGVGCPQGSGKASPEAGVGLVVKADREAYPAGEPLVLTLQVVNRSPQPVHLTFRTTQRYDLLVQDPRGRQVWRWGTGRAFAQVLGEETLAPAGGRLTYRITVRERFPPGRYTLIGIIPADEGPITASTDIRVE